MSTRPTLFQNLIQKAMTRKEFPGAIVIAVLSCAQSQLEPIIKQLTKGSSDAPASLATDGYDGGVYGGSTLKGSS